MTGSRHLHLPSGTASEGPFALAVTPQRAGWRFAGLRVAEVGAGEQLTFHTGTEEMLVLPLRGSCRVATSDARLDLAGRASVFDGVTDFAYLPAGVSVTLSSAEGGRFALPSSRCERRLATRYGRCQGISVELRGAGPCSRQVNSYCTADVFEADRLIVVEVLTPAGNWSSFPPHKHDEARPGEAELEEIYYFEITPGPTGPGAAYYRGYGTTNRPLDLLAEVRDGDAVLVPHGWHGPVVAMPGYDLYYLNVMAGPAPDRAWLITDDPRHAWVRQAWREQAVDPRLPYPDRGEHS